MALTVSTRLYNTALACAIFCIAKQPVLAAYDEGFDGAFGAVVVDTEVAVFNIECLAKVVTAIVFKDGIEVEPKDQKAA